MSGRPARPRGREAFSTLQRTGRRVGDATVRVHFAAPGDGDATVRVAYAINRKVGGAVVRNQLRRRLRAIASEASDGLSPGAYLIGVGPDVHHLTFGELRERVITTMRRASEVRR